MKMLTMLWRNFWGGARTLRFPARPTVTERYRGLVQFNPDLCTGCAICRFRCTSGAIQYKAGKGEFYWSYDPGRCTFCGRCVEGCKAHALSQESACPPVYQNLGELKKSYTVARKAPAPKATSASAHAAVAAAPSPAAGEAQ
jgi:formate hydrogenlyase subunit 6